MPPSPLVSIIIPCWNAEQYVGDAIQSALDQNYAHKEIVVIDDGSTDRSLEVIKSFGASIVSETGPRLGGGAARNRGLARAAGQFVQFLDADDLLIPQCVARKVDARLDAPDVTPCCDWTLTHLDGRTTTERCSISVNDSVIAVLYGQIQTVSSPLHRLADLRAIGGFDASLPCCQERDLHLRLACRGVRFAHLGQVLVRVRKRPGGVSDDDKNVLRQHERLFMRAAEDLRQRGQLSSARRFAFAHALAADGRRLFHHGMVAEARRCWRAAGELNRSGLRAAYGKTSTRGLLRMVGPELTERAVLALRQIGF